MRGPRREDAEVRLQCGHAFVDVENIVIEKEEETCRTCFNAATPS